MLRTDLRTGATEMRFITTQDERGWHVYDTVAETIIGSTYQSEQAAEEAAAIDERDHGWSDLELDMYLEDKAQAEYDAWQVNEAKMWDR